MAISDRNKDSKKKEQNTIPCSDNTILEFLRKFKIEFFKFVQKSPIPHHPEIVEKYWIGLNTKFKIDEDNFPCSSDDCTICLMKVEESENYILPDKISVKDFQVVLESVIYLRNSETRYAFLLWYLDIIDWEASDLIKSLESFKESKEDDYLINVIINSGLYKVLSYNKQKAIQEVANRYGKSISLTKPSFLTPLDNTDFCFEKSNKNLFKYINELLESKSAYTSCECDLISFARWLSSDRDVNKNYNFSQEIHLFLSPNNKLRTLQKYFYDISRGKTILDKEILHSFIDINSISLYKLNHWLTKPFQKYDVTTPLLCSCIETYLETGGKYLQTIGGILDLVISHCDKDDLKFDLGLPHILPMCKEYLTVDPSFNGFIRTRIVYRFDPTNFQYNQHWLDEYIQHKIEEISHQKDTIATEWCFCINEDSPEFKTLKIILKQINREKLIDGSLEELCNIDESMVVDELLVERDPTITVVKINKTDFESIDAFLKKLREAIECETYVTTKNERYVDFMFDKADAIYNLIKDFCSPTKYRITQRKNTLIKQIKDGQEMQRETEHMENLVHTSLEKYFNIRFYKTIERPYTEDELFKLNANYHNKKYDSFSPICRMKKDSSFEERFYGQTVTPAVSCYLAERPNRYVSFCAPKLSQNKDLIFDCSYWDCMGKQCYKNQLENCLIEKSQWTDWNMLQLLEAIGKIQLENKGAIGYEPTQVVRNFIYTANRAIEKLSSLQCRECGHLLYPIDDKSYVAAKTFECKFSTCHNKGVSIYLSHCYRCGKGFVDSRDVKQCPNGWYICPQCHSCCSDETIQKSINTKIRAGRNLPLRYRNSIGYGHNDKDIFFCHKCGQQLNSAFSCSNCNETYTPYRRIY